MRQVYSIVVAVLAFSIVSTGSALACVDPPVEGTTLTFSVQITVTLRFDPWTTFGSSEGQFCVCSFRLPEALVGSVDQVRLVETGTDNLIPGFGPWTPSATTSMAVEDLESAGEGNVWVGFLGSISGDVPAGIEADFQIDVTLAPGVNATALLAEFVADSSHRVFTDEGDEDGEPLLTHASFVDVFFPFLFVDGFESGDTSGWSTVTGN